VLRVVEEDQIRLAPEVLGCLLDGALQSGGVEAVALGEETDLGGDREVRQQVASRSLQYLVGAMAKIVGCGVEASYTEVGGCFE
jgi:hypothetical protein